jgi:hypothetical protein
MSKVSPSQYSGERAIAALREVVSLSLHDLGGTNINARLVQRPSVEKKSLWTILCLSCLLPDGTPLTASLSVCSAKPRASKFCASPATTLKQKRKMPSGAKIKRERAK